MAELVNFLAGAVLQYWWWLGLTLTVVALAVALRHRLLPFLASVPASLVMLLAVALIITLFSLRTYPTGDEPHYLIMIQSILRDADLDLRNNYEELHYLEYYPEPLPDSHVIEVGERWYPVHGVGLPVMAVPAYAVGGRAAVVLMLALISVAGLRVTWSTLRRAGFDARTAGVATVAAGLSLPLVSLAGQVYPEVPAFLLVALALHSMLASPLKRWNAVVFFVSVSLLPWLHPKYAVLSLVILLGAAVVHRTRLRDPRLLVGALAFAGSIIGLAALFNSWYGVPLPPNIMPRAPASEDWLASFAGHFLRQPAVGLSGALFDQQYGLFFASPVQLLAVPGLILLWFRRRVLAITSLLVFLAVYLPAGTWGDWHGGWSSPARFFVPVVPVLILSMAAVLATIDRAGRQLFAVLAIASFAHAYLMVTLPGFTRYGDHATGQNYFIALFERFTRIDLTPLFPNMNSVTPLTWVTVLVYLMAVALLTVVYVRGSREGRSREDASVVDLA